MPAFQKLGRYILLSEIASGGMATVFRAKLLGIEGFEKEFAVKKILPHWSHNREFVDMLIDEAKVLVHLHHNNIVQVFELGKEGESYFIAMEFVDGFDLRKILNHMKKSGQRLPLDLVLYIMKQICLGLDFAHTRKGRDQKPLNIIHRDISPQNILISLEGEVKITDFGIARVVGKSSQTATGVLKGKFSYMSPEQALGKDIDQRTDLFALGVVFYEMVFGEKCFDGRNDLEIIEKVKNVEVSYSQDTLEPVRHILIKAMSPQREARFQSAREFHEALATLEREVGQTSYSHHLKDLLECEFAGEIAARKQFDAAIPDTGDAEKITAVGPAPVRSLPPKVEGRTTVPRPRPDAVATAPQDDSSVAVTIVDEKTVLDSQTELFTKTVLDVRPRSGSLPRSRQRSGSSSDALTTPLAAAFTSWHRIPLPDWTRRISRVSLVSWGIILAACVIAYLTISSLATHLQKERFSQVELKTVPPVAKTAAVTTSSATTPAPPSIAMPTPVVVTSPPVADPLPPLSGNLTVTAQPNGATIEAKVGDKSIKMKGTLKTDVLILADPVKIPVTVTLTGYKSRSQEIVLTRDKPHATTTVSLEKLKYGTVVVRMDPYGVASVSGAGASREGHSHTFKVPTGPQTVTVSYRPQNKAFRKSAAINVAVGHTITCRAKFTPLGQGSLSCQ